jgi:hypothetical protein
VVAIIKAGCTLGRCASSYNVYAPEVSSEEDCC